MNVDQIKHYENRIEQLKQERDEARQEVNMQEHRIRGLHESCAALAQERDEAQALAEEYRLKLPTTAQAMAYQSLLNKYEEAEAKCAEMRGVLHDLLCRLRSHGWGSCGTYQISQAQLYNDDLDKISHALSSDCGKGWVSPNEVQIIKAELAAKVADLTLAKTKCAEMREAQIKFPDNLSALTVGLVLRFAQAMAEKLSAAQIKHGYGDGWAETTHEWPVPECHEALVSHLKKGDPVDVANFCAFLWYHKIGTADCGRGYVPVSELDYTIRLLLFLQNDIDYIDAKEDKRACIPITKELSRLQALKEGK